MLLCSLLNILTPFFLGMFRCFSCNTNSTTKHEKHKKDWTSKQQKGYGAGRESHLEDTQQSGFGQTNADIRHLLGD